jgi:type I restriction enzyme M protein
LNNFTQRIVNKAWSYAHVLRDDGLPYTSYTEQITFLLFLKMADERTKSPYNRPPIVPPELSWRSLLNCDVKNLALHYRHILEELSKERGLLGEVFKRARAEIQDPAKLRRLIVDLIDKEHWSLMEADVKGDIYEGLLQRSASESPRGAGQYFTSRGLITGIVDVMRPTPDDTVCDPACGTGGFLIAAHEHVLDRYGAELDFDQDKHLKSGFARGFELVPATGRLCAMNLYLHGMDAERSPITSGVDSLAQDPGERFSLILTNPPFGKKHSVSYVSEEGAMEKEDISYERQDFWITTKNKQLNFLQHVFTLLEVEGRCAIVVPDNVLFEGGPGETVRSRLFRHCDVHTLLRLPTGIWYAPGVKANALFFDKKPSREEAWTRALWVYDFRTNIHFTPKKNPLRRHHLDEFVELYKPENRHDREPTYSEVNPDGRWRRYTYEEIMQRDRTNLDISWIRDRSLEDSSDIEDPEVIAEEIVDDLQTALEQFAAIATDLKYDGKD